MKPNKTKPPKKANKAAKLQIEQTLKEKLVASVKELGHNAELIAEDIAKLSKLAAKKFTKKLKAVKLAVEEQIADVTDNQKGKVKKIKLGKKDASKLMKTVDRSVTKVVKKAVKKAKPVGTSVKVTRIATAQKPDMSTSDQDMDKKTKSASSNSAKKAVVKAETNNPVKKVPAKAIPTKKNTSK